jgi:hypothetical protein
MSREEAIDLLDNLIGMVDDNHSSDYDTALQMGIKALEQITKIADIVDGTIDHFEYDDAMDMLYEIKGVIK